MLNFGVKRADVLVQERYTYIKSSLIPEQNSRKSTVSCYGVPRYHGKRLVGACRVTVYNGKQGGTANSIFVPESVVLHSQGFFIEESRGLL